MFVSNTTKKHMKTGIASLAFVLLFGPSAWANSPVLKKPEHKEWSFSLQFGVHRPRLDKLYNGLFKNPVYGYNNVLVDETTGTDEARPFEFDVPLPAARNGARATFELQWHPNTKHSLSMGIASWETNSTATQSGSLYIQGRRNDDVILRRNASLSYTEYHLGWRYQFARTKKVSFFSNISAHEFFDIDYREEVIFNFTTNSSTAGHPRIEILPAQTTSLMMLNFSAGAEWHFQPWFSLDFEAGYFLGLGQAKLSYAKILSDIQSQDGVDIRHGQTTDYTLAYLSPDSTPDAPKYLDMPLDFNGWHLMLRMKFYY